MLHCNAFTSTEFMPGNIYTTLIYNALSPLKIYYFISRILQIFLNWKSIPFFKAVHVPFLHTAVYLFLQAVFIFFTNGQIHHTGYVFSKSLKDTICIYFFTLLPVRNALYDIC